LSENLRHDDRVAQGSSDRSFGLVFAVVFLIIAVLPVLQGHGLRLWAVGVSLILGAVALLAPAILAPANRLWTRFGLLLHGIVSPIALGILFYGVFAPTGLFMRLLGKDPMRRRFDSDAASYWIARDPPGPDAESLKNQF
jgi:hypothetical protein